MGKSFTVTPGYVAARYSVANPKYYNGGDTAIITDADYAALPASLTRTVVLASVSTVSDPVYPVYPFTQ